MVIPRRTRGFALLALAAALAFCVALLTRFEAGPRPRIGAGTLALATSVSSPAPPVAPRWFPERRVPTNARLIVSLSRAWIAQQWPPGTSGPALELHDAAGNVAARREELPAGSDMLVTALQAALKPGELKILASSAGSSPVEIGHVTVEDRQDHASPEWSGPTRVSTVAAPSMWSMIVFQDIQVDSTPPRDKDSSLDQLQFEVVSHWNDLGAPAKTHRFFGVTATGTFSGPICDEIGPEAGVRAVAADVRVVDAAGNGSDWYHFAGACRPNTTLYERRSVSVWTMVAGTALALALLAAVLILLRRRDRLRHQA